MKPGLTGMWQINGRSGVKSDDRIEFDEAYLERWSVWLDVKILALDARFGLVGTGRALASGL